MHLGVLAALILIVGGVCCGQEAPAAPRPMSADSFEDRSRAEAGPRLAPASPQPPRPASWIWLAPGQAAPDRGVACFRREIDLKAMPARVAAWISADRHYRLYVNGHLVSQGPADPGEDYPGGKSRGHTGIYYCDYLDLTPHVRTGVNVLAVEVFSARISSWYGSTDHPGLFFQSKIETPGGAAMHIAADQAWRGISGDYVHPGEGGWAYSPAREPKGWRLAGFDDTAWPHSVDAGAHWPALQTSQIPPMREVACAAQRIVRPTPGLQIAPNALRGGPGVTITRDGGFALQYDRVLSAYVSLRIRGGAGARLRVALNEVDAPGGNRAAALELGEGEQTFRTPFYSSFTVINVTATNVTQPLVIEEVTAHFVSYPVAYRGAFECSDPQLNRLWSAARWATQLCMQDHYLDSPDHQEPICDPGDYMIEALLNDYAFGEPGLTRQDLRKFGALLRSNDYINFHTSYALLWLQMLLDHYDYTGDAALVRELAPVAYGLLDRFATWRGRNGLISEAPDYMFMDWVETAGIGCHHPPAVIGQGYLTAFYYRALADASRVATIMGDTARAARYAQLRAEVAQAFERELWSAEKGLYRDGKPFQTSVKPGPWLPADTDIETFSPHVNTLAVLYDLAPPEHRRAIMERVLATQPLNCQPYFMHYVLNALAHAGLFEREAIGQMRRWKIVPATGTFAEMWSSGDLSHAWGGTPLYQMSARILGVTPLAPGFREISIRPTPCGLSYARGVVPTPRGDVSVRWESTPETWRMEVRVPSRSRAKVVLPVERFGQPRIDWNGRTIWSDGGARGRSGARRREDGVVLTVPTGEHHFTVTGRPETQ